MKNNHKISIIILCYNLGHFLPEAIDSVLHQTLLPSEIIIADDASTDNTPKIAKQYTKKYPRLIKYIRQPKNLGIIGNLNQAMSVEKGDYISILGADDRFLPEFVEKSAQILDRYPKVAIAYTDFVLFGPRAKIVYDNFFPEYKGKLISPNFFEINFPEFNNKTKKILENRNFIHGSSMHRRIAFQEVGGYKSNPRIPEDHFLFKRMIDHGWLAKRIPQALLEYRQHSVNQANIKYQRKLEKINLQNQQKNIKTLIAQAEELKRIKSSKFYQLWPLYCRIKNIFTRHHD